MSRVHVNGPHLGPVRTTLWSSGRRHGPYPWRGPRWAYFTACALTGVAFTVAGPLGWAAIAVFFVLPAVAFAVVKFRRGRRAPRRRMPGDGRNTGFQAVHVPASAAYKAAHPEGPRDWEPVS